MTFYELNLDLDLLSDFIHSMISLVSEVNSTSNNSFNLECVCMDNIDIDMHPEVGDRMESVQWEDYDGYR